MILFGDAFLNSHFKKGDPVCKTAGWRQANRIANVLKYLKVVGGTLLRPVNNDGKNWVLMIGGESDLPYPPGFRPAWSYNGPFAVTVSDDRTTLTVGQGYVFAGTSTFNGGGSGIASNSGEYSWPGSGDTDTFDISAKSDGDYLIVLTSAVDPDNGYFTASYKPEMSVIPEAQYVNQGAHIRIISRFTVESGKVSGTPRQDQYGDVYLPVFAIRCYNDSADDQFWTGYQITATAWWQGYSFSLGTGTQQVYDMSWGDTAIPAAGTEINGG